MQLSHFLTFRAEHCFFCCRIYNTGDLPIATSLQLVNQHRSLMITKHVWKHGALKTPWVFSTYMFHKNCCGNQLSGSSGFQHISDLLEGASCVGVGFGRLFRGGRVVPWCALRPFARECPLEFSVISIDLGEIWACFGKHLLGCYAIVAMKVSVGIFKPKNVIILLVTGRTSWVIKV